MLVHSPSNRLELLNLRSRFRLHKGFPFESIRQAFDYGEVNDMLQVICYRSGRRLRVRRSIKRRWNNTMLKWKVTTRRCAGRWDNGAIQRQSATAIDQKHGTRWFCYDTWQRLKHTIVTQLCVTTNPRREPDLHTIKFHQTQTGDTIHQIAGYDLQLIQKSSGDKRNSSSETVQEKQYKARQGYWHIVALDAIRIPLGPGQLSVTVRKRKLTTGNIESNNRAIEGTIG